MKLTKISLIAITLTSLISMSSIAQAKTTTVKVVETYTSHVVWFNHREIGFVWLTDQGALQTWSDNMNNNAQISKMYNFYPNGNANNIPAQAGFENAVTVFDYYNNDFNSLQDGTKLAYSNTVYSINSLKNPKLLFEADNNVPQFGVRSGETVKKLSNGMYLYPSGKEYRFKQWQEVNKSQIPAQMVSELSQGVLGTIYFYRYPMRGTFEYVAV